jgi:hypothetical protein
MREVKHTRVLFGDLRYVTQDNPYKPSGIRKMKDVWLDPSGDGYVSVFPGYSEVVDLADSSTPYALGMVHSTKADDTYIEYPVIVVYDAATPQYIVYILKEDGTTQTVTTLTEYRRHAGGLVNYTGDEKVYLYTGVTGTSTLGFSFPIDPDDLAADGTSNIGLERPDVATSGAASALGSSGGAVKGVVKYFVSYTTQDGTDEGALSVAFGKIDAGDGYDINLTGIPTDGTNKRRIYRTFSDGDQPFHVTTLNDSDTTYTDNIADVDLGDLPLKYGDPPNPSDGYSSAVIHFGRAYIVGTFSEPNRVYFSDPKEYESFYTALGGNWFTIDDSFKVRTIGRVPAGLIVLGSHSGYLLRGRSPSDFIVQELMPVGGSEYGVGCQQQGSLVHTPYGVFFYDNVGYKVYAISPDGQLRIISDDIGKDLRDNGIDQSDVASNVNLSWWSKFNLLFVSINNKKTWAYDIAAGKWIGRAEFGPRAMSAWNRSQEVLGSSYSMIGMFDGAGDDTDVIYQMMTGTTRDGSDPSAPTLGSPTFTGSDPTLEKTFLYVDVLTKPVASETLDVKWFIDGASSEDGSATITMTATDSRERHRVYINERGRELDIDLVFDASSASGNQGVYGLIYGYTEDTSVVNS